MRFLIALLILLLSVAKGQNSVRIFNPKGELFRLRAGDNYLNASPQAEVLVENVNGDTMKLRLEPEKQKSSDITLYLSEKGKPVSDMEFDYVVDFSHTLPRIIFTGMYERMLLPDPLVPPEPVIDTSFKINNNLLGHFCEVSDGRAVYFNNLPKNASCTVAMPAEYMNFVKLLMAEAQTDDNKYVIIEQACRNNCLSVAQLKTLLHYSNYEIERLKLLKIGYMNVTDSVNRKELETCFRFKSSVNELNSFFRSSSNTRLKPGNHCRQPSDSLHIQALCQKLSAFENDAQRYSVLRQSCEAYCYSLEQVAKVLGLFIHDREKLDAAKLLYFYSTDAGRYGELAPVFSYHETAGELRDFVSKQSVK